VGVLFLVCYLQQDLHLWFVCVNEGVHQVQAVGQMVLVLFLLLYTTNTVLTATFGNLKKFHIPLLCSFSLKLAQLKHVFIRSMLGYVA
jgi:hypothetical protein